MAMWKNPKKRKIQGRLLYLQSEGISKSVANDIAQQFRNRRHLARVIPDDRMGRYDVQNRSTFYCVYVTRKPVKNRRK